MESLKHILVHTLEVDDTVNWDSLKDHSSPPVRETFYEPRPEIKRSPKPILRSPKISFFDHLFSRKAQLLADAQERYERELADWTVQEAEN